MNTQQGIEKIQTNRKEFFEQSFQEYQTSGRGAVVLHLMSDGYKLNYVTIKDLPVYFANVRVNNIVGEILNKVKIYNPENQFLAIVIEERPVEGGKQINYKVFDHDE